MREKHQHLMSYEDAPSNIAIVDRYLLKPENFDILENQGPGVER